jgi:hypothetical protein
VSTQTSDIFAFTGSSAILDAILIEFLPSLAMIIATALAPVIIRLILEFRGSRFHFHSTKTNQKKRKKSLILTTNKQKTSLGHRTAILEYLSHFLVDQRLIYFNGCGLIV